MSFGRESIKCASWLLQPGGLKIFSRAWQISEDTSIVDSYQKFGPSWALIACKLPGRSPTECRRRWLTRTILPTFQIPEIPDPPNGPEDLKRRTLIAQTIKKAHQIGLRKSSTFPSQTIMRPLTKAKSAEWNARMQGFEPIGSKWVLLQEEKRIPIPYGKLSVLLHAKKIPRWKILKQGWTESEDFVLREAYEHHGPDWIAIHYALPKRTWQECRRRLTMLSLEWNPITTVSDSFPIKKENIAIFDIDKIYSENDCQ